MGNQKLLMKAKLFCALLIGIILGLTFTLIVQDTNCTVGLTMPFKGTYTGVEHHETNAEDAETLAQISDMIGIEATMIRANLLRNNNTLASKLFNETRVLCWVLTGPKNHAKRALHVKNTWGGRCNKLIFMSSEEDMELGAVKLNVGEGRGHLWNKTREAVKYIYDHHLNDADWFIKADDDTYIIAENLRVFLHPFDTNSPVYFGCKFKPLVRQGYMSGGAGYVMSKEAVRRFAERAYPNAKICRQRAGGSEDKEMGTCLQNVGVVAGDSRDDRQRGRFFPSMPQRHLVPKEKSNWYWRYVFYSTEDGLDCCSDYAISFHYVQPSYFYVLDYLIYQLRPFGVFHELEKIPPKITNMSSLLDKWRLEPSDNNL